MRQKVATESEIRATFHSEHDHLFWLASLITADEEFATRAITKATALSTASGDSIFHDWLVQWVRSATIRNAAGLVRSEIRQSAERYKQMHCEHGDHAPLSASEMADLHEIDHAQIKTLDPMARAVLVFRGIQHASVGDCALSLGVSRGAVTAAYCRALAWVRTHCTQRVKTTAQAERLASATKNSYN